MKKLLIFTDTVSSQINWVNTSIKELKKNLEKNIELTIISSDDFLNVPLIWYKEIKLSILIPTKIEKYIKFIKPDFIHIATEWPIWVFAVYICKKLKISYTTSFHSKYPEYVNLRISLIKKWYVHKYLHYIHDSSEKIFISNSWMLNYLEKNSYKNIKIIPFWIDHSLFYPWEKKFFLDDKKVKLLFVWRIAIEKNIEAFLKISYKYTKIIVWDWPDKEKLEKKYIKTKFLWYKKWIELADIYRSVDVFVFPSLTDTLWLVNLEAFACWKPILAYNIDSMKSIVENWKNWILVDLDKSLETWIKGAMNLNLTDITKDIKNYNWKNYALRFMEEQVQINKNTWN